MTRVIKQSDFIWRGLDLHFGQRRKPVLTLVADKTYPHLYRIRYPDSWLSASGNLTRAKDAAYGHARYLLGEERPVEDPYTAETPWGGWDLPTRTRFECLWPKGIIE